MKFGSKKTRHYIFSECNVSRLRGEMLFVAFHLLWKLVDFSRRYAIDLDTKCEHVSSSALSSGRVSLVGLCLCTSRLTVMLLFKVISVKSFIPLQPKWSQVSTVFYMREKRRDRGRRKVRRRVVCEFSGLYREPRSSCHVLPLVLHYSFCNISTLFFLYFSSTVAVVAHN